MRRTAVLVLAVGLAVATAEAGRPLPERLLEATEVGRLDRGLVKVALKRGGWESRLLAARLLAGVASPEGTRQLALLARDPEPRVRRMALLAAGRIGKPASGIVARAVRDPNPAVRAAAVWAALQLEPVPEALARFLAEESSPEVIEVAAAGIGRAPGPVRRVVLERVEALGGERLERALALGLGRSGLEHARLRALARSGDPWTRAAAVAGLGRGKAETGDRAVVVAALGDPEEWVRTSAAQALARRREWKLAAGEAAALVAALDPRSPQLAVAAVRALGAHPEAADAGALERLMDGPSRWLAAEALQALARRGWEGAPERIADWLGSGDRWRREAAAEAAAALPDGSALGNRALDDPEPAVRLAWLQHAPERAVPQAALSTILARDPDPAVRAAALERQMGEIEVTAERLLKYYGAWRGDRLGDARAVAILGALERAPGRRGELVKLGSEDPDPAVQARVAVWAWRHGLEAPPPRRVTREREAYAELLRWMREPQWVDLVTDRGTVRLLLEPGHAPITARRFWERAASGRYDGTTFHRVVPNFVVQGGDPRGDGWGSGGLVLPDEPSLMPFDPGAVGIATSGPNTGGCQFFAMLGPAPHLVGRYTRFARVVRGAEVLARIERWDRIHKVRVAAGEEPPPPAPVWVGAVEPARLLELPEWREGYDAYQPDPETVARLAAMGVRFDIVGVLGTWCSDSRREIPRLLKVVDALPPGQATVRLWAVDRTLAAADPEFPEDVLPGRRAERVATVVVRDTYGMELGRVVETAELPWEELLLELASMAEGGDDA